MQEALFAQRPSQGSQTFTNLPKFYRFLLVLVTARNLRWAIYAFDNQQQCQAESEGTMTTRRAR
jgi:hypothetical protein